MASKKQDSWLIYRIRKKSEYLGTVAAPDRETAIKVAIKSFKVDDADQQKRLMAQRRT
jgi:hypothetical protein